MKRRTPDTTTDTSSTTAHRTPSTDDPDRPTLKRHTAEDAKKAKSSANRRRIRQRHEDPSTTIPTAPICITANPPAP